MREELIASAITFLQDPSVAASPLEKRVAFLQSKNLTPEEIDAALRRVGEAPASTAITSTPRGSPPAGGSGYALPNYNPYFAPPGQQQPPVPARDWRDWFVMATITGGVGYGIYFLAKRYVVPLIAPPTPPQLESDKADIDRKFTEAFDILSTLQSDTAALKSAEEERKNRVDAALEEVESVVQDLKTASKRREDESKRVGDEVRSLRDLIPKALEGQKDSQKKALEDLQSELQSLKSLVINRTAAQRPQFATNGVSGTPPLDPGAAAGGIAGNTLGGKPATTPGTPGAPGAPTAPASGALPFGGVGAKVGGKPAIPAWQMAAASARANSASPGPGLGANPATPGAGAAKQPTVENAGENAAGSS
ncbi:hypothetical protein EX30DRAFT_392316 [Ascodesmis nigricans]|uniref:Peroxisomal membrane protein PEX14 n=1 Tax=Ascodesmis nigricans TaxID=341454 RepID=A0A4S2N6S0_9PEZI|nr:hypothetical protein EX30DRAFT_392316 [Ascodesmis nigricans]